jgi:hypothetical protein
VYFQLTQTQVLEQLKSGRQRRPLQNALRHREIVMSVKFSLVDLGCVKEETRFGFFIPPTDGFNAFFF